MVTIYSNNHLRNGSSVSKTDKNKNKQLCGRNRMSKNKYSVKRNIPFHIVNQQQLNMERYFKKYMDFLDIKTLYLLGINSIIRIFQYKSLFLASEHLPHSHKKTPQKTQETASSL